MADAIPVPMPPYDPDAVLNSIDTLGIDEQIDALEGVLSGLHRQLSGAQG